MAKINIQGPAMDGALAVAGGGILGNLLTKVPQVAGLLDNLPAVAGIDLKAVVYGAAALVLVKNYIFKG